MAELPDAPRPPTPARRTVAVLIAKILLATLVMAATTTVFSLFVWTVLPFAAGWSPSVVLTGSMQPSIVPGDIVVTAPIETSALKPGYVVRFQDPAHPERYVMHRIVVVHDDATLTTRGDNNGNDDSTPVPAANVTGVARLRVPMIGLPALWLRDGHYLQLGLVLIAVLVAARTLTGVRGLIVDEAADGGPADARPEEGRPVRPPGGRHRGRGRARRRRGTMLRHQRVIAA